MKKKFKDTRVGKFLIGKNGLFKSLSDAIPTSGFLSVIRNLIIKDDEIPKQDKETALKLIEIDSNELMEVSKRWESVMTSDIWLSKNVRPLTLLFLTLMTTLFVFLVSTFSDFVVGEEWINLLKTLLTTVYVAYFGSRGIEKYKKISSLR